MVVAVILQNWRIFRILQMQIVADHDQFEIEDWRMTVEGSSIQT